MKRMLYAIVSLSALLMALAPAAHAGPKSTVPVPACANASSQSSVLDKNKHCAVQGPQVSVENCQIIVSGSPALSQVVYMNISGSFGTVSFSINNMPYTVDFDYDSATNTISTSADASFCGASIFTVYGFNGSDSSAQVIFTYPV